jgi:hypothetical protein
MSMPRSIGLPAILLAAALLPAQVHAFAQFGATAITNLTLSGIDGGQTLPTGVSVLYGTSVVDLRAFSFGWRATVSSEALLDPPIDTGLIDMPFGVPLGQAHSVNGWAGNGLADARMLTNGGVFLGNASGAAVTFSFSYVIDAVLTAAADPFGLQARVDAAWLIDDLLGLVDPGGGGRQPISFSVYADPITGTRELRESGTFSITLDAGADDTLTSALDTWGIAEAPEPPVWALLALGLAVASIRQRATGGTRRRA